MVYSLIYIFVGLLFNLSTAIKHSSNVFTLLIFDLFLNVIFLSIKVLEFIDSFFSLNNQYLVSIVWQAS